MNNQPYIKLITRYCNNKQVFYIKLDAILNDVLRGPYILVTKDNKGEKTYNYCSCGGWRIHDIRYMKYLKRLPNGCPKL